MPITITKMQMKTCRVLEMKTQKQVYNFNKGKIENKNIRILQMNFLLFRMNTKIISKDCPKQMTLWRNIIYWAAKMVIRFVPLNRSINFFR